MENECIHSRKVSTLFDLDHTSDDGQHIKNHIENCEVCRQKINPIFEQLNSIVDLIPIFEDKKQIQEFNQEVRDVFKEVQSSKKSSGRIGAGNIILDLARVFASRNMIILYVFVCLLFMTLTFMKN